MSVEESNDSSPKDLWLATFMVVLQTTGEVDNAVIAAEQAADAFKKFVSENE